MEAERGTTTARTESSNHRGLVARQDPLQAIHASLNTPVRNIEIDWREVDPYFSELSDCASFWTLIYFTCDVIYSGLFVLFFIMGQDVESMFFEGLLNHINPILIYLILSLIINYGALRSLRCGREKCFLVFSILKCLLFPITMSLLVYLVFFDVQEYFGTFWISFVVIVSCYNGTAALGLWSMFTCNKYILVNEAAQKRLRKQAKQQRSNHDCRCHPPSAVVTDPPTSSFLLANCESNRNTTTCRPSTATIAPSSSQSRRRSHDAFRDSSSASNIILVSKPETTCCTNSSNTHAKKPGRSSSTSNNSHRNHHHPQFIPTSNETCFPTSRRITMTADDGAFGEDDDEVLQISTVHKVMQEIRSLDSRSSSHYASDESL